jgi:predicted NBD/HSP70 family sugar kinase
MEDLDMNVSLKRIPALDPDFLPAVLWNREFRKLAAADPQKINLKLALCRLGGTVFRHDLEILSHEGEHAELNNRYVERLVKFLLWHQGGSQLYIAGCDAIAEMLSNIYCAGGERDFDNEVIGVRIFGEAITVKACSTDELPEAKGQAAPLGRHLDGCRIGFDLGGSDRKAAAVIDGEVVFSEEIRWDPYFESDPQYHVDGIKDSLRRAAEHLPRVDAIGGSAAGCYINNEVRLASLFRGIEQDDFDAVIRPLFKNLREEWGGIPIDVVNDGEVTALAGSMSLKSNAVLGISMGTSLAAGYCDAEGHITPWLNELAFVPVDYKDGAPADEWSGDIGCGVQYFSQQAVGRLTAAAGIELPEDMPLAEKLVEVQKLMEQGDERARKIYETIGVYFGYAIAQYAEFYDIQHLLILGRVTSGEGGQIIIQQAEELLALEFPEVAEKISISTPDEKMKRHGQAIAAASLPSIGENV